MKRKYGKRRIRRYRKYKRYYRKSKKARRSGRASSKKMPTLIVPDRTFVKLKYSEQFTWEPGTILPYLHSFVGNSLYDPDYTNISGAQPNGFDQWARFYKRYRVYGSKIDIRALTGANSAVNQSAYIGCIPSTSPLPTGDTINDLIGRPYNTYRTFQQNAPWMGNIKKYMSVEKIWGLNKKTVEIDNEYVGLCGDPSAVNPGSTSPSKVFYWNVWCRNCDPGSPLIMIVRVTITFYAEFFDRVQLDVS